MQTRLNRVLENFIVLVIVLVLIQTFLEDFAVLVGWSLPVRQILMILGFAFDVIFTLEFFARSIFTASRGTFGQYFLEDRGWIDFLASVPLLLFNSGPELFAFITLGGTAFAFGGILQVLKVVKAIRIARVLRFLRVLKIFRRIKNAEAVMAQRHIARIATMVVATLIISLFCLAVVDSVLGTKDVYLVYDRTTQGILDYIDATDLDSMPPAQFEAYAASIPIILLIKNEGKALYSRFSNRQYELEWANSDYGYIQRGPIELFIDISNLGVTDAKNNIRYFLVIIILILVIMFLYSPHFALTISDPIHVMRKGFDEQGYNLQVRIPARFKDDEIYRMAASFNAHFLPLKDRESQDDGTSVLQLSLDDLADLADIAEDGEGKSIGTSLPNGDNAKTDGAKTDGDKTGR